MPGTRTHPTRQDSRVMRATANRAAAGGQGAPHLQTEGEEDVALSRAPRSAPSLARPPLGRGSIPITAGLGDAIGHAAGQSHLGSLLLRAGLHNLSRRLPAWAVLWLSPRAVLCRHPAAGSAASGGTSNATQDQDQQQLFHVASFHQEAYEEIKKHL